MSESLRVRDAMIALVRTAELEQLGRWVEECHRHHAEGRLEDEHLQAIIEAVDARRRRHRVAGEGRAETKVARAVLDVVDAAEARVQIAVARSPAPRVEHDPEEIERREREMYRRRATAKCLSLPARIAGHFKMAALAVLTRIAWAHRQQGWCQLPVAALAAAAHCSERAVQAATALAEHYRIIRIERQRRAPNRITVIGEWADWLRKAENQDLVSAGFDLDEFERAIADADSRKKKESECVSDSSKGAKISGSYPQLAVDRPQAVKVAPPAPERPQPPKPPTAKPEPSRGILGVGLEAALRTLEQLRLKPVVLSPLRYVRTDDTR